MRLRIQKQLDVQIRISAARGKSVVHRGVLQVTDEIFLGARQTIIDEANHWDHYPTGHLINYISRVAGPENNETKRRSSSNGSVTSTSDGVEAVIYNTPPSSVGSPIKECHNVKSRPSNYKDGLPLLRKRKQSTDPASPSTAKRNHTTTKREQTYTRPEQLVPLPETHQAFAPSRTTAMQVCDEYRRSLESLVKLHISGGSAGVDVDRHNIFERIEKVRDSSVFWASAQQQLRRLYFGESLPLQTIDSRQDAIQQFQQNPLRTVAYHDASETNALPNLSCADYARELRTTTSHQQVAVMDTASAKRGGATESLKRFEHRLKTEPSFDVSTWEDFIRPLASLQMPCTRAEALPRILDSSEFSILERSRKAYSHEPPPTRTTFDKKKRRDADVGPFTMICQTGNFTPWHRDHHGYSTAITMLSGIKEVYYLDPAEMDEPQREAFEMNGTGFQPDHHAVRRVVLQRGDQFLMPPGTIHSVITMQSSVAVTKHLWHVGSLALSLELMEHDWLYKQLDTTNQENDPEVFSLLKGLRRLILEGSSGVAIGDRDRVLAAIWRTTHWINGCKCGNKLINNPGKPNATDCQNECKEYCKYGCPKKPEKPKNGKVVLPPCN